MLVTALVFDERVEFRRVLEQRLKPQLMLLGCRELMRRVDDQVLPRPVRQGVGLAAGVADQSTHRLQQRRRSMTTNITTINMVMALTMKMLRTMTNMPVTLLPDSGSALWFRPSFPFLCLRCRK